jgi:hypothetical protein
MQNRIFIVKFSHLLPPSSKDYMLISGFVNRFNWLNLVCTTYILDVAYRITALPSSPHIQASLSQMF